MTSGAARLVCVAVAFGLIAVSCSSTNGGSATFASSSPRLPTSAERESAFIFDQNELRTYELTLRDEDLAFLDGDPAAETYVEGSLKLGDESLEAVGIRYKGSIGAFVNCLAGPDLFDPSGAKKCTKLSMKVKINWEDPNAEFHGLRKLQFHSQNLDPTQMHERLGYWLFSQMGVAAPRSVHARLVVNGEYLGVFALTEQIDGRFVRASFDDGTGNLYKEVWPFDQQGNVSTEATFLAGLRTNEDASPSADLIRSFAQDLRDAVDPRSVVSAWMDVDDVITHVVVDRTIRNDDGPFHWYCFGGCSSHNFFFYEDPTSKRIYIIPWDLDNAFENIVRDANPVTPIADAWGEVRNDCKPFPYGVLRIPQRSAACDPLVAAWVEFEDEYQRLLVEFANGPFSADRIDEVLMMWTNQIADATREAADLHDDALTVNDWKQALDDFRDALDVARERALS